MKKYILKRALFSIATILLVLLTTFILMNLIPGTPFYNDKSTPEQIQQAEIKYGLDKPLIVQFFKYVINYLKGDFGVSLNLQRGVDVSEILFRQGKFELSIRLGVIALFISCVVGIVLGTLSATFKNKIADLIIRGLASFGTSMPIFVVAGILINYLSINLSWLPSISGELKTPASYIMPLLTLSFYYSCCIAKIMRASMLDTLSKDYIKILRARGVSKKSIIFKHAVKNSLNPIVTYTGQLLIGLITGSFVVESVFLIPGMSRYFIQSILSRDYPIIMATTFIYATLVIIINITVDLIYKLLDPRIDLSKP